MKQDHGLETGLDVHLVPLCKVCVWGGEGGRLTGEGGCQVTCRRFQLVFPGWEMLLKPVAAGG